MLRVTWRHDDSTRTDHILYCAAWSVCLFSIRSCLCNCQMTDRNSNRSLALTACYELTCVQFSTVLSLVKVCIVIKLPSSTDYSGRDSLNEVIVRDIGHVCRNVVLPPCTPTCMSDDHSFWLLNVSCRQDWWRRAWNSSGEPLDESVFDNAVLVVEFWLPTGSRRLWTSVEVLRRQTLRCIIFVVSSIVELFCSYTPSVELLCGSPPVWSLCLCLVLVWRDCHVLSITYY